MIMNREPHMLSPLVTWPLIEVIPKLDLKFPVGLVFYIFVAFFVLFFIMLVIF